MGRRRTWMIVLGIIALVLCVPLLLGGIVLAAIFGADGTYTTGNEHLSSQGHAIVSAAADISGDSPVDRDLAGVRLLVNLTSSKEQPLFVGVGRAGDVTRYLDDVSLTRIDDVQLSPFRYRPLELPGTREPGPPDEQTFWVAKSVGTGEQDLSWRLRTGTYQVVVMNADGSASVDVTGSVGVKIPWIFPVALGLIVAGVLLLTAGVLLVVFGGEALTGRGRRRARRCGTGRVLAGAGAGTPATERSEPVASVVATTLGTPTAGGGPAPTGPAAAAAPTLTDRDVVPDGRGVSPHRSKFPPDRSFAGGALADTPAARPDWFDAGARGEGPGVRTSRGDRAGFVSCPGRLRGRARLRA